MSDLEKALQQKFGLTTSHEATSVLRTEVLALVDQELRAQRRDRLATRMVFTGLLLGILGNFAVKHHEETRLARSLPPGRSTSSEFFVETEQPSSTQPSPTPNLFEGYLLAFYPSPQSSWGSDLATRSAQARAVEIWLDEFAKTGRGL